MHAVCATPDSSNPNSAVCAATNNWSRVALVGMFGSCATSSFVRKSLHPVVLPPTNTAARSAAISRRMLASESLGEIDAEHARACLRHVEVVDPAGALDGTAEIRFGIVAAILGPGDQ